MLTFGRGGIVDAAHVVAVAAARSAPIKRLLLKTPTERILNLTYGYPRESVLILDNGFLVIVSLTVEALSQLLNSDTVIPDDE